LLRAVGRLFGGSQVRDKLSALRAGLAVIAFVAVLGITAGACSGPAPPSARDRHWRQDIAYLARELPAVRAVGLGAVSPAAWEAAAANLRAEVPRMTDGQLIAGLARMVAMLNDDETLIEFPPGPIFRLDAQWVSGGLYLLAVPAAYRALLGVRLLAVDGHPVAQVMARAGTVIDAEDRQLRSNSETGALDDAALLHWLGITASAAAAVLTIRTAAGSQEAVRITAAGTGFITWPRFFADQQSGMAHAPLALYEQDATQPYWMRILPAKHAVYLKYNQCLPDHRPGKPVHRFLGDAGRAVPAAGRRGADRPASRRPG
jgi:hypothetical protein